MGCLLAHLFSLYRFLWLRALLSSALTTEVNLVLSPNLLMMHSILPSKMVMKVLNYFVHTIDP